MFHLFHTLASKTIQNLFIMKFNSLPLNLFVLVFSMFLFASCADKKSEKKTETQEETSAIVEYQCPMDCEEGTTYHEAGSCPVCKMDLKTVGSKNGSTCKQHKNGKCTCEGAKCKCDNCAEHSKVMTCNQHKDGKCSCEGAKCACVNCAEHSKAMTCTQHKDGKCTCEGEKCECVNCAEHSK